MQNSFDLNVHAHIMFHYLFDRKFIICQKQIAMLSRPLSSGRSVVTNTIKTFTVTVHVYFVIYTRCAFFNKGIFGRKFVIFV